MQNRRAGAAMELTECILTRKSIRGYKATPVPKELIIKILDEARRSPSCANTQPWEFAVFGGQVMEEMRKAFQERFLSGVAPNPEVPYPLGGGPSPYLSRHLELSRSHYHFLGIDSKNEKQVQQFWLRGFGFFGSPMNSSSILPTLYRPGLYWMWVSFCRPSTFWLITIV